MIKKEFIKVVLDHKYTITPKDSLPVPQEKSFTKVPYFYSNNPETQYKNKGYPEGGVYGYYTLQELVDFINADKSSKKGAHSFLKGIYEGGTSGSHCVQTADLLFYDIDIKADNENKHIFRNPAKMKQLQKYMEGIAVLAARSHSGTGMFGVLHVPNLSQFSNDQKDLHLEATKEVWKHIQDDILDKFGFEVFLDSSQGAFRQVRHTATQKKDIFLNTSHTSYELTVTQQERKIAGQHPVYKIDSSSGYVAKGSAWEKFNTDHPIEHIMIGLFERVGTQGHYKFRYASQGAGASRTSGQVKDGKFISNSSSFHSDFVKGVLNGTVLYDSVRMYMAVNGVETFAGMYEILKEKGYENDAIDVKPIEERIKDGLDTQDIAAICMEFQHSDYKTKNDFFETAPIPPQDRATYRAYLGIKPLLIEHDVELSIKRWVSEVLPTVFDLADKHRNICLTADTGSGKTTSILKDFETLRPNKRILIVAPLTAIVRQVKKLDSNGTPMEEDGIVRLVGSELKEEDWDAAELAPIVVATHAHAASILAIDSIKFDYIVRDEIHSDVLGMSFRLPTIRDFTYQLTRRQVPVIALTGTPMEVFVRLGFFMVKIAPNGPKNKVIQRLDNRSAKKIVIQHHKTVKRGSKVIYRANSFDALEYLYGYFLAEGYTQEQVVIFSGRKDDKTSEYFQHLETTDFIHENVQIVLTTGVIDEGVSIRNKDFSDCVFIGSQHHPRPEPLKQFLNRFRDPSPDMKLYHYRAFIKEEQQLSYESNWEETVVELNEQEEDFDEYIVSSYRSAVSDDEYRYKDGSVNPYYLAWEESTRLTNALTVEEFNEMLELNYHITVELDKKYGKTEVEIARPNKEELDKMKSYYLLERRAEVLAAVWMEEPRGSSMKTDITYYLEPNFENVGEDVIKFVKLHYKYFKSVVSALIVFRSVSVDPDKLLLNDEGEVEATKVLGRKTAFLKLQRTLQTPLNKKDTREGDKLRKLVSLVNNDETALDESRVMDTLLRKAGIRNKTLVGFTTWKDFLSANSSKVWDRTSRTFVTHKDHSNISKAYMKGWLKPFAERTRVEKMPRVTGLKITPFGYKDLITQQLKLAV